MTSLLNFIHPNKASAADATVLQLSQPDNIGVKDLNTLLNAGFTVAIIIAIIFVLVMIISGGYTWLTAGGEKGKVEEARNRITNAIIGMAIVAAAWAIVTLVSRFFGVNLTSLNIPSAAE